MAANTCGSIFSPKHIQFLVQWGNKLDLLTNTPLVGVLSFHSSILFEGQSGKKVHVVSRLYGLIGV